ncbi:hypothetical protein F5Y17DRAFT_419369 [Xylariaceae sp. FL0594]|nr:hypothetical protein F5Y17DRAFT_419369 [Xylariaceae sp. FL0594]
MLLLRVLRSTPLNLSPAACRHNVGASIWTAASYRSSLQAGVASVKAQRTLLIRGVRFETTSTKNAPRDTSKATPEAQSPPAPKFAFPARLCVYHAGTGRITFLSCLKLSTLFIFAFFGFVITPAHYEKEGFSSTTQRTALCAIAPLIFVAYITSPFVAFIHMRLPPFARQSEEMLRRYVRSLPPQTELEITTMSLIAKPRVSTVRLSELEPVSRRLGIVNLARDTAAENATRRWYRFRAVGDFSVQQTSRTAKAPWTWEIIRGLIGVRHQ